MGSHNNEQIFHIIGFVGSITLTLSFIPITYSKIKNNDFSLNPYFSFLIIVSSLLLLIYSIYFVVIPMIIANLSVLINNLILVYMFCYTKENSQQYKIEQAQPFHQ